MGDRSEEESKIHKHQIYTLQMEILVSLSLRQHGSTRLKFEWCMKRTRQTWRSSVHSAKLLTLCWVISVYVNIYSWIIIETMPGTNSNFFSNQCFEVFKRQGFLCFSLCIWVDRLRHKIDIEHTWRGQMRSQHCCSFVCSFHFSGELWFPRENFRKCLGNF